MTNRRTAGIALFVLVIGTVANAPAQMFITTGRDTLRGLPGVEVQIEALDPELERTGLTRAAIRAGVVERLLAGGVAVYASQSANASAAKPYLYVDVNGVRNRAGNFYAVAVQVQLRQILKSPVTGSNVVDAMTWDARTVRVVPGNNLATVRLTITEYVDHFVDDWRTVHR